MDGKYVWKAVAVQEASEIISKVSDYAIMY